MHLQDRLLCMALKKKKKKPTNERKRCGSSGESMEMKNRGRRR